MRRKNDIRKRKRNKQKEWDGEKYERLIDWLIDNFTYAYTKVLLSWIEEFVEHKFQYGHD